MGVVGRIAFFRLDNTEYAILGQRAFVGGTFDGMRSGLTPELITVSVSRSTRDFRQGIRGRLLRWLGV